MKAELDGWIVPGQLVIPWPAEVLARQDALDGGPGWEDEDPGPKPALVTFCWECHRRFTPQRSTAKFCSARCRKRGNRNAPVSR